MANANLNKALAEYGKDAVRFAKLELGTSKLRPSRRTKWRWTGSDWEPLTSRVVMRKRRAVASGRLQQSIKYAIVDGQEGFTRMKLRGLYYGQYVENGRKAGKYAPPPAMQRFVDAKKLRARTASGGFARNTPSSKKGIAFVINRSIKHFGIEPNPFAGPAERRAMQLHFEKINKAIAKDIGDALTE